MSQKLKIVTIGGGSSYTPELLEGFMKRYHELPVTELWLVDVEEGQEKLDIIHALCQRMVEKAGVPMKVTKRWIAAPRWKGRISSPRSCALAS
jgi:6-phospho-beta-glucosidase